MPFRLSSVGVCYVAGLDGTVGILNVGCPNCQSSLVNGRVLKSSLQCAKCVFCFLFAVLGVSLSLLFVCIGVFSYLLYASLSPCASGAVLLSIAPVRARVARLCTAGLSKKATVIFTSGTMLRTCKSYLLKCK